MLNTIFDTIFITTNESTSIAQFLLCIAVSLLLGFFFAIVYRYKNHATQSFLITLALLPATVCAIMFFRCCVRKNRIFRKCFCGNRRCCARRMRCWMKWRQSFCGIRRVRRTCGWSHRFFMRPTPCKNGRCG